MSDQQEISPFARISWRLPAIALAATVTPLVLGAGYYLYRAEEPDPLLQSVVAEVHRNATAQTVLGQDIALTGLPTFQYCHDKSGEIARFTFSVKGDRGEGSARAAVFVARNSGRPDIKSIALTAPGGSNSDIVGTAADENWLETPGRHDDTCLHLGNE